ncbi:MAG: dihydroorotate dehydrogenase electron transfer subunit [Candidatus Cloacimonetes bacterium]|nr:dihydroorotate dehydrogenase electron transfer subunit [Candidatus Cloacimonadota bacterium]
MKQNIPVRLDRRIYSREELCGEYFILWIWDDNLSRKCHPGQFFEIRAHASLLDAFDARSLPKLYKPISIYDNADGRIGFFIKKVGAGTSALAKLKAGDKLELIGPLGNGFNPVSNKRVLLLSGGIGYPPLWYLQKELINHNKIFWLHGGANQDDVFPCDEVWTMDGSFGKKGMVTEGLAPLILEKKINLVYSCGPIPMLKQAAKITRELGIRHYTSLEAYMACGIGVCHGCAVPIRTDTKEDIEAGTSIPQWDYLRVCKEGPVFNAEDVMWSML